MTEAEWLNGHLLRPMLDYVCGGFFTRAVLAWFQPAHHKRLRKLRLFAVACVRHMLSQRQVPEALDLIERCCDGVGGKAEWRAARRLVNEGLAEDDPDWHDPGTILAYLILSDDIRNPRELEVGTRGFWSDNLPPSGPGPLGLLRDVFGNPFRPSAWNPAWYVPTVRALATATYQEREPSTAYLHRDRLAILSDALEDAGCTNADLLGHLRGPGPHVRGCWALDFILGKS
jgi:hypothetical protein